MLHDPLGEVARKERRSLLGISGVAVLVGWTGLVPEKIENFGIIFTAPERRALLWVFLAVVVYYTLAFLVYSFSDLLSYLHAIHRGRLELRKPTPLPGLGLVDPVHEPTPEKPWAWVGQVTFAALTRGIFDFGVPLLVAGFAIWSLWGAVHQVETKKASPTPPVPAVAPAAVSPSTPTPALQATPPTGK